MNRPASGGLTDHEQCILDHKLDRENWPTYQNIKPFRQHVTAARKVVRPGPAGKMHPVLWRFTELALIESRTLPEGALYSVVESYGLCGRQKAANNSETP